MSRHSGRHEPPFDPMNRCSKIGHTHRADERSIDSHGEPDRRMGMTTTHDAASNAARRGIVPALLLFGALLILSACAEGSVATTPAAAPVAAPEKPAPPPLTATQINGQCWLKYEASRADLDKRMN